MMKAILGYLSALGSRQLMPTAARVALVVGTLLLTINHGSTIITGQMTQGRWISAMLTYLVPYSVSIHGQYISRRGQ